jgi:tripartite ATP-independent transporter DctP family solute receptor
MSGASQVCRVSIAAGPHRLAIDTVKLARSPGHWEEEMKKVLIGALALALGLGMVSAEALAQAKQLKIATIQSANGPWHKAMMRFKEIVESKTNGAFDIQIYTDGQMGDTTAMMTAMQLGALDMVYQGATSASYMKGGEALNVMMVPYIFKDGDSAEKVLNSPEFMDLYDQTAKASGIRLVAAWGQRSPRALQTLKGPISKPEDVKGLRIRIPPIKLLEASFKTLGAQITPTGILEIYNGLARGSLDGQDNGFDLSYPNKFHEIAKHWSSTDHVREIIGWFASEKVWQSLTDEQREVIRAAAKEAGAVATELQIKADAEARTAMEAAGVTFTVPDHAAFAAALADVYKDWEGNVWPAGLVERIRKMQE